MPTAIMPKRAIPIAADVSVEPVSPSEAWPARRDARGGNRPAQDEVDERGDQEHERLRAG